MNVAVSAGANAAIIASLARSRVIEHFEKAGVLGSVAKVEGRAR